MKRLVRPLLWLLGLAGLAAAVGLHRVPHGHVATRVQGDRDGAVFTSGPAPGVRFWHTWRVEPVEQVRLYGAGGRPALRLANGTRATLRARLVLSAPLPAPADPVRASAQTLKAQPDAAALEGALRAALEAHPSVASADVQLIQLDQTGAGDLPPNLRQRLDRAAKALDAARATAREAAAQAATATERAEAQAALEAAKLKSDAERELATIRAGAARDVYTTRAAADAAHARLVAEGELAHAQAMAEVERLTANALASEGGRWLLAVEAARSFKLPPNMTLTPESLQAMGSVAAWKRYFAGGLAPHLKSKRGIDRSEN